MKSDTPDELFVFPDSDSLTPNLLLLSSDADSVFFTDIIPPLSFFSEFDFSVDDLPF